MIRKETEVNFRVGFMAVSGMVMAAGLAGCGGGGDDEEMLRAAALMEDTSGRFIGNVSLTQNRTATGEVQIVADVQGLPPGTHGIHLHAVGTCDETANPPFSTAGGHFNPLNREHGLDNPNGPHAGDLPNLVANNIGHGTLTVTTNRVTLGAGATSLFDADGSAVVIHEGPDDHMSNPAGNSGGRIACGVIQLAPG